MVDEKSESASPPACQTKLPQKGSTHHVLARVGAVHVVGAVGVDSHVDVDGSAGVVAGEDGLELDEAVIVGGLKTAKEGGVQVAVVGFEVAAGRDARVDT